MRILLAEKDRLSREAMAERLIAEGFNVTVESDGFGAFVAFNEGSFPIVICQRFMPEMDGLQFCRSIRQNVKNGNAYFILLTGANEPEIISEALDAGVDDYLITPVNSADLAMRANIAKRAINTASEDMLALTLSKLVELRSNESSSHLQRIKDYSQALANELGRQDRYSEIVDSNFVKLIGQASWLHDIGKVAIPDSILLKSGSLTPDERSVMEKHAEIGAEVFKSPLETYPENEFIKMAYEIALHHHEKWDGTGYPRGLRGEGIPLAARIVAVADVYDALTSVRVYNKSVDHEFASELITLSSGKHFDPMIVDCFVAVQREFQSISKQYADREVKKKRRATVGVS